MFYDDTWRTPYEDLPFVSIVNVDGVSYHAELERCYGHQGDPYSPIDTRELENAIGHLEKGDTLKTDASMSYIVSDKIVITEGTHPIIVYRFKPKSVLVRVYWRLLSWWRTLTGEQRVPTEMWIEKPVWLSQLLWMAKNL